MMKWFIGVSGTAIVALCAWGFGFITMGYQAQADIKELKSVNIEKSREFVKIKQELHAVKAITERTEKNTEEIRKYLLERALNRR